MDMSFDVKKYLKRIGITGTEEPTLSFLKKLHPAHLLNIPFENLSIHNNEPVILDSDNLYNKIVIKKRGGFCYELNYLFYTLLTSLNFNVRMISARVFDDKKVYGPEFDHMALIVTLGKTEWLCDVGFGDSFIEPVEFILDKEQKDRDNVYKISLYNNSYFLLSCLGSKDEWESLYLFTPEQRPVDEYFNMCTYHQTSPDSHFSHKRICTKLTSSGRITLTDRKFIITNNKIRNEVPFEGEDKFNTYLKVYFNIKLLTLSLKDNK